jgi:hypothetical protein
MNIADMSSAAVGKIMMMIKSVNRITACTGAHVHHANFSKGR